MSTQLTQFPTGGVRQRLKRAGNEQAAHSNKQHFQRALLPALKEPGLYSKIVLTDGGYLADGLTPP